jgi:hypothetical protein
MEGAKREHHVHADHADLSLPGGLGGYSIGRDGEVRARFDLRLMVCTNR